MTYEAWRITFQSSEQAARSAYVQVEALAAALRPFAEAFQECAIQSYAGADAGFAAFLDRNAILPAGITMGDFRAAWEALNRRPALSALPAGHPSAASGRPDQSHQQGGASSAAAPAPP